jgi:hypothetical protein
MEGDVFLNAWDGAEPAIEGRVFGIVAWRQTQFGGLSVTRCKTEFFEPLLPLAYLEKVSDRQAPRRLKI